ncbi:MAG TPA: ABC transporter permease [Solirubrobacteraceae bacterium]|nr:ABC transporter permease [Solirubrobacteraceae bacterium]
MATLTVEPVDAGRAPRPRSLWRGLLASAEGRAGVALAALILAVVILGPALAPHNPDQIGGLALQGPSAAHPLGTDELGRDVLSRFLAGGRTVLLGPLAATTLAFLIGGTIGMLGAFRGGLLDIGASRLFDLFIALPGLLIVLVVITRVGTSFAAIVIVVALNFAPRAGRIVRGATQAVVGNDYVAAARLRGERVWWILARELLPNAAPVIIANYCLYLTYAVIFVSTLSFLGLGAQPPSSDWGLMVSESREFIQVNPWATVAPALGIASMAVAFTLLGDALTRQVSRSIGRGGSDL